MFFFSPKEVRSRRLTLLYSVSVRVALLDIVFIFGLGGYCEPTKHSSGQRKILFLYTSLLLKKTLERDEVLLRRVALGGAISIFYVI